MISPDRFLVERRLDYEEWLRVRADSVSASDIKNPAQALRPLAERAALPTYDNAYMAFGRDFEWRISMFLKDETGIMPNEWVIAAEAHRWQVATPDGLSLDHTEVSEIKTTGVDYESWGNVRDKHMPQVQWQMYVTGAERCAFAWMLRVQDRYRRFQPGWMEPKWCWVDRDQSYIDALVTKSHEIRAAQVARQCA